MEEVLVPVALFATIPLTVWAVQAYGAKTRREVQETIRVAVQNGQPLSPDVIRALGAKPTRGDGDLRWGMILVALALAFIGLGFFIPMGDFGGDVGSLAIWPIIGTAMFPGFVGAALLILHFTKRGRGEP